MRDEVIYFLDMVPGEELDEFENKKEVPQKSEEVYAELLSISQTEFYQAQTSDKKPEIKFMITDYLDYQGQKYLIHDDIRYKILRTYRKKNNELEITCYGGVRDVSAAVSDEN